MNRVYIFESERRKQNMKKRICMTAMLMLWVLLMPILSKADTRNPVIRSSDTRILTEKWAVRLEPGQNPDAALSVVGAENMGQIGHLPCTYLFYFPGTYARDKAAAAVTRLKKEKHVKWYEQQEARWRFPRSMNFSDPLFPDQWHLKNTGQHGLSGEDINVELVWEQGITGRGIIIGIVDDGLQYRHPDIADNYRADLSYDFNDKDSDPDAGKYDDHGTSAAGVAAARDNSSCGVGAAYRAKLAALRLIAEENTDADEAEALSWQREAIHIYSNSWGPDDDGKRLEGPGTLCGEALEDNIRNGRNGLGNIYVWASGNGLTAKDNINYDGYANSRFTIAVGSSDYRGKQTDYGEPGAAMLVNTPSDTDIGGYVGITATDLMGTSGNSTGDCRNNFGGTSASAPLAAGVIALMLEANPNLSWRDVQHILIRAAKKNDASDTDWVLNAAGLHINHKYGFGRLDAAAAVSLADSWQAVPEAVMTSSGTKTVNQAIPDNDAAGISSTVFVEQKLKLEHVEVIFTAAHNYRGQLQVILTSPWGTQSVLAELHRDRNSDYEGWKFMTVRDWDESSFGEWKLTVSDMESGSTGRFDSWELILYGTPSDEENYPPRAQDDTVCTDKDTSVTIAVLSNDTDMDGDILKVTAVSEPANGTALANTDNTVTYSPKSGFIGNDTFAYTVSDADGKTATADVFVTVANSYALSFDGNDDYVDCGTAEGLNLTGSLTLEAWINPSDWGEIADNGFGRVLDKKNYLLYLNNTGSKYNDHSLVFATEHPDGPFSGACTPENSIQIGVWQHIAVTYDGKGSVRMYIGGEEQLIIMQPYGPPSGVISDSSNSAFLIAESAEKNRAFHGSIDEIRVWNIVRSPEEIRSALSAGLSGREQGLAGYWPVNGSSEDISDSIRDCSGNGNDGVVYGAVRVAGAPVQVYNPFTLSHVIRALKILSGEYLTGDETEFIKMTCSDQKIGLEDVIRILQKLSEIHSEINSQRQGK